jgi:hypothetical protein
MTENHNFGEALQALKTGKHVSRSGWNGKGMFLALAYPSYADERKSASIEFNHKFENTSSSLENFIVMKTADNKLIPWLASQTDMLSDDWCILD